MKKLILSLLALFSFSAMAAGSVSGTVTDYVPAVSGSISVRTAGTATGQPGCASGNPGWFIIDTSTEGGRQMATSIRFAFALGRTVTLVGTNACTTTGTSENLSYMGVAP